MLELIKGNEPSTIRLPVELLIRGPPEPCVPSRTPRAHRSVHLDQPVQAVVICSRTISAAASPANSVDDDTKQSPSRTKTAAGCRKVHPLGFAEAFLKLGASQWKAGDETLVFRNRRGNPHELQNFGRIWRQARGTDFDWVTPGDLPNGGRDDHCRGGRCGPGGPSTRARRRLERHRTPLHRPTVTGAQQLPDPRPPRRLNPCRFRVE